MGSEHVIRIEIPRATRRIPGLGDVVFCAPGAEDETALARFYGVAVPDHRAFATEAIVIAIKAPPVDAGRVDALSERARASCRVAVAEVVGCGADYRRLAGKGLSGDERLFAAMQVKHERDFDRLRLVTGALRDNVIRLAERTRTTLIDSGATDYLARNQYQLQKLSKLYTQPLSDQVARIDQISRQLNKIVTPTVIHEFAGSNSPLNSIARSYLRLSENVGRQLESVLRPEYFGALAQLSEQINRSVRPRYIDQVARLVEQVHEAIRPQYVDQLARTLKQLQPHYAQFVRAVERTARAPAVERLREQLLDGLERYYAWLERNWATFERPHPILFLLAALPMAIGLPLLRALKTSDEPLLQALEDTLAETTLVDALQQAVQASTDLDDVAKRYLVTALEAVRDQRYIDAAPPLAWGLLHARDTADERARAAS
jgi:hypothetical protein